MSTIHKWHNFEAGLPSLMSHYPSAHPHPTKRLALVQIWMLVEKRLVTQHQNGGGFFFQASVLLYRGRDILAFLIWQLYQNWQIWGNWGNWGMCSEEAQCREVASYTAPKRWATYFHVRGKPYKCLLSRFNSRCQHLCNVKEKHFLLFMVMVFIYAFLQGDWNEYEHNLWEQHDYY